MQNCYSKKGLQSEDISQDERLTKKHIETLSFVQELGFENKVLKAKLQELEVEHSKCTDVHKFAEDSKLRLTSLQEELLKRNDEVTSLLTDKHRNEILKLANEKVDMEESLQREINSLKVEVTSLKSENNQLKQQTSIIEKLSEDIKYLRSRLDETNEELLRVRSGEDHEKSERQTLSELEQIQTIKASNAALTSELAEVNQKNRELQFRISKLESELQDAIVDKADQDLVESLKNRLTKVHNEKLALADRETQYNSHLNNLNQEIQTLKKALNNSETERTKLKSEYGSMMYEIVNLKRQLRGVHDKQNFKDFVALKREIGNLREENFELKEKGITKQTSLPLLRNPPKPPSNGTKKLSKDKRLAISKSASRLS